MLKCVGVTDAKYQQNQSLELDGLVAVEAIACCYVQKL